MKILIASNNKNKIDEIKLKLPQYQIFSLEDLELNIEIEEDGLTYEENSYKKAFEIHKLLEEEYIVIADDSGLEVEALNNYPNIYSARCAGEKANSETLCNHILDKMKNEKNRKAKFVCVITIIYPDGSHYVIRKEVFGDITNEIQGETKFGMDPIFYCKEYKKTYAELDKETKNSISHRGLAIEELKRILNNKNK